MANNKLKVIGFGALNVDTFYLVKEFSQGEKIPAKELGCYPGGSAANTIVGLSRLGIRTGLIGAVGNDENGNFILENLTRENVDISGIVTKEGNTGRAFCFINQKGDHTLFIESGVNDFISKQDIDINWVMSAEMLHFSSFGCFKSKNSFETQKWIANEFRGKISLHLSPAYIVLGFNELNPLLTRTHILFIGEDEIKQLTKSHKIEKACDMLIKTGVRIIAVTRRDKGCFVTDGHESYYVPAPSVKVVDTTGAGDAFAAGFLYGYLRNKNLKNCGELGNIIASFCIQKIGCQTGLPSIQQLKEVIDCEGI